MFRLLLLVAVGVVALAAPQTGPVQVSEKPTGGSVRDVIYADSLTVFVITNEGELLRSTDGGKSWTSQNVKLPVNEHSTDNTNYVEEIHISPADPRYLIIAGRSKKNWASTDMGATYAYIAPIVVKDVKLHPRHPTWLLASAMSEGCEDDNAGSCYKTLFVSKDFGHTFTLIRTYIVQFEWSPPPGRIVDPKVPSHGEVNLRPVQEPTPEPTDDLVYVTSHHTIVGSQSFGTWQSDIDFLCSADYFKTWDKLVPRGNRFLFSSPGYLLVAAVREHHEAAVDLYVSNDDGHGKEKQFRLALLPGALSQHSYTVLDTSEGSIFLNVNPRPLEDQSEVGHVYLSDWSGSSFSLSLPYNQRRPYDGTCVFYKIESLEGVYIANRVLQEEDDDYDTNEDWQAQQESSHAEIKSQTIISFNKGGSWLYLMPPSQHADGSSTGCSPDNNCYLHFLTSPDIVYSSPSAVGVIIATGMMGRYLQPNHDDVATFFSRDGGVSWTEVAKGRHVFGVGDHGGVIVLASIGESTDHVLYSWNQGISWQKLIVSSTPIWVDRIFSDPTGVGVQFLVTGSADKGFVIYLDFAELHTKECQGQDAVGSHLSDFEAWAPRDHFVMHAEDHDMQCLMGRQTKYLRRKKENACFNPEKVEAILSVTNCTCQRSDFECDYGYKLNIEKDGAPCEKDPDVEPLPETPCRTSYYVSKGYRRVAGDTCIGGEQWDGAYISCSSAWLSSLHLGKFSLIVLLIAAIAFGCYNIAKKYEFVEDAIDFVRSKFSGRRGYHDLNKKPISLDDDEEFGQSSLLEGVADKPFKSSSGSTGPVKRFDAGNAKKKGDVPLLNAALEDDDD